MVGIPILKQRNTNFEAKVTPGSEKGSGDLLWSRKGDLFVRKEPQLINERSQAGFESLESLPESLQIIREVLF